MYIYNLEDLVSPAEFRSSNFIYPWNHKYNSSLGICLINFDFGFAEDSGRNDYFEISYRFDIPGLFKDTYTLVNSNHRGTVSKLSSLQQRFKGASYVYNREGDALCICVDVLGVRPESFEDVLLELKDHFTTNVGISLVDRLGPCVKHFDENGNFMNRST